MGEGLTGTFHSHGKEETKAKRWNNMLNIRKKHKLHELHEPVRPARSFQLR